MGRFKIKIEKLPTEGQRKLTYLKRRKGILKKTYEISTLCDAQAVLIMFSPSGKLAHFSTKPGIWDILQRFVNKVHSTSEIDTENLEESKDVIASINDIAAQYDAANSSSLVVPQDNNREMVHDEIEVMLLELQKKMMHPDSEAFDSTQEFENLIHGLENVRSIIVNKKQGARTNNITLSDRQKLMEQLQQRIEDAERQKLMEQLQQRIEDAERQMLQLQQGGERMQQQGVRMFGLSTAPSVPLEIPRNPLLGREHIQQHRVPVFGTRDPSPYLGGVPWQLPMPMQQQRVPAIGGQQNIHTPTSLFEQFHAEPFMEQYRASVACGSMPQLQGGERREPLLQQGVPAIGAQQNIHTPTSLSQQLHSEPFMEQYRASVDSTQWLGNLSNNWDV